MKAWVLKGINELEYMEVAMPDLREGWCLVKVMAAGICGSDIPRIFKTGAHKHPLIPGHEFSGLVIEGSKRWKSKRVGVFPLIPCEKCEPCREQKYEMCKNYNYLGSRCDGGFAEYVLVPERNLIEIPDEISYEQAAMFEPLAVAVHAVRKVETKIGKRAVVIGLGTIGLMITMLLNEMGIAVHAIGNKAYQYEKLEELGIKSTDIKNGEADYVFECVGKNESISETIEYAKPEAEVIMVGNPASDICFMKDIYWKILRNQLTIKGTWNSSFTGDEDDDWHYVIKKIKEKAIHPERLISHRFPMNELNKGLDIMRLKTENYTKILLGENS